MATTTGGTTYVTSTDLVANYPTASLALANRVDVVASGGPVLVKTAGYTITVADILAGNKFLYNSASSGTFTLPTSSLVDGMVVEVAQIGAGALTVSGGTIVGTAVTSAQYQSLTFVYVASGTTWYSVAPPSSTPGISLVSPSSIANSGGTASSSNGTTVFTGVSSISLNGCFTSTYDNYRVVFFATPNSTVDIRMRFRASGADNSSANYKTNSGSNIFSTGQTSGLILSMGTSPENIYGTYECMNPALAYETALYGLVQYGSRDDFYGARYVGTTAFDGLTIYPTSGAMTGNIRVYGYKGA